ncbi:cell wall-binding protein [Clostridium beijerinckii]|uniref:cell wall-binding protein n=1 Tax=Clostridium beijerinckii TaxID=1520 RepID=UPI001361341F|nr:cell wall-binding protein [Clostridium beijerinckii]MZK61867.1 cell wall-binding protein [Clostridium beijerinckii]MZK70293.1 cell wall-binding protein [Clostridium beijerinckii]MZK77430.1 cell wall-binding protein [Clostridium beijerinckii]MZK85204.1 cell wall-binding protein [Clostridium beijerinckii]
MEYDIYIGNKDKTKVYKLPIIPEKLPELTKAIQNEEFETWWDGKYNFIEKPGLLEFSLDCWLPAKNHDYNFAKSTVKAPEVIQLLENARDNAECITIVIIGSDGSIYVSDKFSIESFKYKVNWEGDYEYSLSVKKYRDADAEIPATVQKTGWLQDSTGWWYVYDANNNYYRDCWQKIDGEWYSFDFQGYARQNTWLQDGGYWYWLKKDSCKMARNEWVWVDGKSYYFGDLGGMYANCYTPDGYWVGSDGAWIQ